MTMATDMDTDKDMDKDKDMGMDNLIKTTSRNGAYTGVLIVKLRKKLKHNFVVPEDGLLILNAGQLTTGKKLTGN
jgi:hypothetical protein